MAQFNFHRNARRLFHLVLLCLTLGSVQGVLAGESARDVVVDVTDKVTEVVKEAQDEGYFDKDPQRFYDQIETLLDQVIDFDRFARGVMGKYASREYYATLTTDEEREQFKARIRRFSTNFKEGLVETYAKGLLAFNGNRIQVMPMKPEDQNKEVVIVEQHIYGKQEKPYIVQYTMRRDRDQQWKLANVTIEAVNLGKVYRSQFYSSVQRYDGDLDAVVNNWSVEPAGVDADKLKVPAQPG